MYVEINELDLSFNFESKDKIHLLTIWTDGGFVEVHMNDEELEKLKCVLK